MTDAELQVAIDKTMAMAMSTLGNYHHDKFREMAKEHLNSLFKIQAMRAGLLHEPGVRPGAIVEVQP